MKKKLNHEEIRQLIHSAPNERMKKLWEGVLKKLESDPPPKPKKKVKPKE